MVPRSLLLSICRMPSLFRLKRHFGGLLCGGLVLFVLSSIFSTSPRTSLAHATTASPPVSLSRRKLKPLKRSKSLSSSSNTTSTTSTTTTVVRMVETQLWNGSHWNNHNDKPPPEQSVPPPPNSEWVHPWKTVGDEWEYRRGRRPHHEALRQRTWTRAYRVISSGVSTKQKKGKTILELLKLQDEWDFKGFGWTFYKSLWHLESTGVALRLPLTYNLDTFERHPALPSMSASLACYTAPLTIALFWSMSLRLEFLQWSCRRVTYLLAGVVSWILWVGLIRSLAMVIAGLLFPLTRNWPEFSESPLWIQDLLHGGSSDGGHRQPQYSRTVEERLGCSFSWRISTERGYEFRTSFWHYVAPTLASLYQDVLRRDPPDWIRRQSAAWGFSTSGPIHDSPHITTSAIVSLSGFHFSSVNAWLSARKQNKAVDNKEDSTKKEVLA